MHFVTREFRFPDKLSEIIARYFWGSEKPTAAELKPLSRALAQLWPVLAKGRGQQTSQHYSGQAAFTEAYAAYYLTANAMKIPLILEEAAFFGLALFPGSSTIRWVDVGSGPGTALWGLSWWSVHRGAKFEYRGLEQSSQFVGLAERLSEQLFAALGPNSRSWKAGFNLFRHASNQTKSLLEQLRSSKPHVVSMMNSIGELCPSPEERKTLVDEIIAQLGRDAKEQASPRWLVIVEPGAKDATRELLALRESLRGREDVRIWLPCLDDRPCGALAHPHDWCHEEAAIAFPEWMNKLGAEAGLRKEALVFSYLVLSIGVHPAEPASWPLRGKRVVSQMMHEKGLDQCFLCGEAGKVKARVLRSRQTDENSAFVNSVRGQVYDDIVLAEKGDVQNMRSYQRAELDATVFPPLQ